VALALSQRDADGAIRTFLVADDDPAERRDAMRRGNDLYWGNTADADALSSFHLGLLACGRHDVPVPLAWLAAQQAARRRLACALVRRALRRHVPGAAVVRIGGARASGGTGGTRLHGAPARGADAARAGPVPCRPGGTRGAARAAAARRQLAAHALDPHADRPPHGPGGARDDLAEPRRQHGRLSRRAGGSRRRATDNPGP
jgi:hypothetical protein